MVLDGFWDDFRRGTEVFHRFGEVIIFEDAKKKAFLQEAQIMKARAAHCL